MHAILKFCCFCFLVRNSDDTVILCSIGCMKELVLLLNITFSIILLQQGHRQDLLSDTFWLMTFFESASLIGSQALANWLVHSEGKTHLASAFSATIWLAVICIICISWLSMKSSQAVEVANRKMSYASILHGEIPC